MEHSQDDAGSFKSSASPIALPNPDLDPAIGLEKIRRIILDGMSKACFLRAIRHRPRFRNY